MKNIFELVQENFKEAKDLLIANGGGIKFTDIDYSDEEKFFDLMDEEGDEFEDVINNCPTICVAFEYESLSECFVLSANVLNDKIELVVYINNDYGQTIDAYYTAECLYFSENNVFEEIGERLNK